MTIKTRTLCTLLIAAGFALLGVVGMYNSIWWGTTDILVAYLLINKMTLENKLTKGN